MQIAKEETKGRTINFEQLVRTLFTSELRKTAGRDQLGAESKVAATTECVAVLYHLTDALTRVVRVGRL
jgi:hypothetical protein